MSEEIIFADMLNHYSLKTGEISGLLNEMVTNLNKSVSISNECWQSDAAQKYFLKVSTIINDIKTADLALEHMLALFNVAKSREVEAQLEEINAKTEQSVN